MTIETNKKRKHRNKLDFNCQDYHENYISVTHDTTLTRALHTKVLKTFASVVMEKIVLEMYRFTFPHLGKFYMVKRKIKVEQTEDGKLNVKAPTNWKETKRVQKVTGDRRRIVVYLNEHTNGYIYRMRWDKLGYNFVNKSFYTFVSTANLRHYMTKQINGSIKPLNAYTL